MAEAPPSETLFVTGLPIDCTHEYGKEIFSQYGAVKQVTTLPVAAGKSAKAAFVIMETVDDAKWIVENVNGNVPQNLTDPVTVVFATPRSDRGKGKDGKGMKGKMKGMMNMMMNSWGGWGYDEWGGKGKGGGAGSWDNGGGYTATAASAAVAVDGGGCGMQGKAMGKGAAPKGGMMPSWPMKGAKGMY
eukprot:CAMPEP_0114660470 /NCGR_PEP_ID=MMETSP0191-20121206/20143_1 /TAXON_ID=126664 /ORGANISM="Sorites sp." /LENGTH=187 /DNA_ID=CAMNT_0001889251 /DNA_START=56 /DNA_END=620 /DNA_ORIENTATION=-